MQTLELGEVQIQQFGTPTDVLIRVAEADDAVSTERDLMRLMRYARILKASLKYAVSRLSARR